MLLCLAGCGGLFEVNPEFGGSSGEGDDATTSGDDTTPGSVSTSTDSASASGGESSESSGGSDVPTVCGEDTYEPNDRNPDLAVLNELTANAPMDVSANISDSADEDWFKIAVNPSGAVHPIPAISLSAPEDLQACIYFNCAAGETSVDCGGQVDDMSSATGGDPGCCGVGGASVAYLCDGAVELNGNAYVRIRASAPVDACVPYEATVRDDA